MKNTPRQFERNLRLYAWLRTFTKRVYFPVISIMLVQQAHLTMQEIGIIGATGAVVQGLLQLPTGYAADKLGNRKTMLVGALIALPAALFYAYMQNFWGALIGLSLYMIGQSFIGGAAETLVHDTLVMFGRAKQYSKEVGRAQSIALGGNFLLVSLVPMTYAFDHRLPFLIGFLSAAALVVSIALMVEPPRTQELRHALHPFDAMKKIVTWQNVSLFIFAGLTGGVVERSFDFLTLALVGVGIPDFLTGTVAAISSIIGAVLGWYIHVFDRLRPSLFYAFDLIFVTFFIGVQGASYAVVVVPAFVLFLGYARVRYIVFQSKLFEDISHSYKATLMSALSFFSILGGVFTMLVFGNLAQAYGFQRGLMYFAAIVLVLGIGLLLFVTQTRHRAAKQTAITR